MRPPTSFVFNSGARGYAFLTAQDAWRSSCRRLVEDLDAAPRTIVDLGCGPGVSTFEIARARPLDRVLGLDFAAAMLDEARRRERGSGFRAGRIQWLRADAARLPFRDGSVDVLTGHSFLYLLPDRTAALRECVRVLRPGGMLRLMEPNASARLRRIPTLSRNLRYIASVLLWRPFSRLYGRFSAKSLAETLERAGFTGTTVDEALAGQGLIARATRPSA